MDELRIPKSWPPRKISAEHCTGWPEVKLLQALLLCRGYNVLVDGIWSDELAKKFRAFQVEASLQPKNTCGPEEWAELLKWG